jgi:hypothetical protein
VSNYKKSCSDNYSFLCLYGMFLYKHKSPMALKTMVWKQIVW